MRNWPRVLKLGLSLVMMFGIAAACTSAGPESDGESARDAGPGIRPERVEGTFRLELRAVVSVCEGELSGIGDPVCSEIGIPHASYEILASDGPGEPLAEGVTREDGTFDTTLSKSIVEGSNLHAIVSSPLIPVDMTTELIIDADAPDIFEATVSTPTGYVLTQEYKLCPACDPE